ncbi:Aste57867_3053 [Aphanomyces stellatus]|uniref:Aste57867_3053 protein n=1 Tax=Aphanomyces stellatus TaxID=120398 RepID=A0A485K8Y9_9STRA|nr:hypothetical protein As57867_003044 [Aphanomyces stellatus]VFT80233.1 Aste57867_3053 [Aphanomyces stellatus]
MSSTSNKVTATTSLKFAHERLKKDEAQRLRKYREGKKSEVRRLQAQVQAFEMELKRAKTSPKKSNNSRPQQLTPYQVAAKVLQKYNHSLRGQVEQAYQLACLMASWVAAQTPQPGPHMHKSWMESTLLANPDARRQGYQWLSERIYHAATRVFPRQPLGGSVQDAITFTMHTRHDEAERTIAAMENHVQTTFFGHFKQVAQVLWHCMANNATATFSYDVVDAVHDQLLYVRGSNPLMRTTNLGLVCVFEEPRRIVTTYCLVAHDECYPLCDDELRTHGFGWTIHEHVTDDITLTRHSMLYGAPITKAGHVSLQHIGRLYGQGVVAHRDAYIEAIRAVAEVTFVQGLGAWNQAMFRHEGYEGDVVK